MEGLAITPDGKTLVGMMQGPLTHDGGVSGSNVRILVYDLTNPSAAPQQYLYQLDSSATPISELLAVNNHKFLVDERDGVAGPSGIKKLYQFDLNQATAPTDLATSAFPGTTASNGLPTTGTPAGVVPLQKSLFANIGQLLNAASPSPFSNVDGTASLPDKIEGYSWGPDLADGRHLLLATNDNDFVQPGGAAGSGHPNYIFAFAVDPSDVPDFQPQTFDAQNALNSIDHIVVIYQENWPFDGLYGSFPGANGLANASTAALTQIDRLTGNAQSTVGGTSYNNPAFAPSGAAEHSWPARIHQPAASHSPTAMRTPASPIRASPSSDSNTLLPVSPASAPTSIRHSPPVISIIATGRKCSRSSALSPSRISQPPKPGTTAAS